MYVADVVQRLRCTFSKGRSQRYVRTMFAVVSIYFGDVRYRQLLCKTLRYGVHFRQWVRLFNLGSWHLTSVIELSSLSYLFIDRPS